MTYTQIQNEIARWNYQWEAAFRHNDFEHMAKAEKHLRYLRALLN